MDNPNVKAPRNRQHHNSSVKNHTADVNLRRHKSLPGPLRSIRPQRRCSTVHVHTGMKQQQHSSASASASRLSHLNNSKSNPYVGWFRHAPSLLPDKHVLASCWLLDPSLATVLLKKRRYVAKGHHLNNKLDDQHTKTLLQIQQLLALKEQLHTKQDREDFLKKRGYLRGGGKDDDLETFLQEQCTSSESATVKVLSRLACWFLDVPAVEDELDSPNKFLDHHDSASLVSDDDDDESCEYDNYDTAAGSRQRSNSVGDDSSMEDNDSSYNRRSSINTLESSTVLSSQAEAYYALTAVCSQLLLQEQRPFHRHRSNSLDDDESRLDYDITQMDIVRMNRIASRHLDVESIVRLPVLTYEPRPSAVVVDHSPVVTEESSDAPDTSEEPTDDDDDASSVVDNGFSWMLVPPPPETAMKPVENSSTDRSNTTTVSRRHSPEDPTSSAAATQEHRDLCVICLEHFVSGDRLRVLPCTHSFHVGCIDRWLSGSHSFDDCYTSGCPTCKKLPTEHHDPQQQHNKQCVQQLDGSVPSWAFAQIGDALARESQHF